MSENIKYGDPVEIDVSNDFKDPPVWVRALYGGPTGEPPAYLGQEPMAYVEIAATDAASSWYAQNGTKFTTPDFPSFRIRPCVKKGA